jgi:hypothetical protein
METRRMRRIKRRRRARRMAVLPVAAFALGMGATSPRLILLTAFLSCQFLFASWVGTLIWMGRDRRPEHAMPPPLASVRSRNLDVSQARTTHVRATVSTAPAVCRRARTYTLPLAYVCMHAAGGSLLVKPSSLRTSLHIPSRAA